MVTLVPLLGIWSGQCNALSMVNETCIGDRFKAYRDLVKKTSSFVGDNRTILEDHVADFGLEQRDVEQVRSTVGEIYCPGTKHKNPAYLSGVIMQTNDTLVTNFHALYDENNVPRDPLSDCTFTTQDELAEGLPGHHFDLGDGPKGIKDAVGKNKLLLGSLEDNDHANDWAVIKLKTAPKNTAPLKLPSTPVNLHGCKVAEEYTCQKVIGIAAHDHELPNGISVPWGKTVISSFDLYGLASSKNSEDVPSRMFTDRSSFVGSSGGVNFLANRDGTPVRINGSLVPIGIVSAVAPDSDNGKTYNGGANVDTELVGLDGRLATAVRKLAGESLLSSDH